MTNKTRIITMLFALLVVCSLLMALFAYCRGKRIGEATTNLTHTTQEVSQLEDEKGDIAKAVHALDTDSLRVHILDLSRRAHEEAARARAHTP